MFPHVIRHACLCICLFAAAGKNASFASELQEEPQAPLAGNEQNAASATNGSTQDPQAESDKSKSDAGDEQHKKKTHRGSIVVAPLPIVSPALGAGIVPVLGYIFPLSTKDQISPPSVVGAAGLVTDDGSRGFAVGTQLFMKENRYEVEAAFANGNLNYNLYGGDFLPGLKGAKLPLEQRAEAFFISPRCSAEKLHRSELHESAAVC